MHFTMAQNMLEHKPGVRQNKKHISEDWILNLPTYC